MVELSTADEANVQGNEAFANQRIDDAIELYTAGLRLKSPQDEKLHPVIWSNRSSALAHKGHWSHALVDADECILLKPRWARGYACRGAALEGLGRMHEALDAFKRAADLDPSNATFPQIVSEIEETLRHSTPMAPSPATPPQLFRPASEVAPGEQVFHNTVNPGEISQRDLNFSIARPPEAPLSMSRDPYELSRTAASEDTAGNIGLILSQGAREGDHPTVVGVEAWSPLLATGVWDGHQLIEVDGDDASCVPFAVLLRLLSGPPDTPVSLTFQQPPFSARGSLGGLLGAFEPKPAKNEVTVNRVIPPRPPRVHSTTPRMPPPALNKRNDAQVESQGMHHHHHHHHHGASAPRQVAAEESMAPQWRADDADDARDQSPQEDGSENGPDTDGEEPPSDNGGEEVRLNGAGPGAYSMVPPPASPSASDSERPRPFSVPAPPDPAPGGGWARQPDGSNASEMRDANNQAEGQGAASTSSGDASVPISSLVTKQGGESDEPKRPSRGNIYDIPAPSTAKSAARPSSKPVTFRESVDVELSQRKQLVEAYQEVVSLKERLAVSEHRRAGGTLESRCSLTIEEDYDQHVGPSNGPRAAAYAANLASAVADSLNISQSRVLVGALMRGSVVADITISGPQGGSLVRELARQAKDPSSRLRMAVPGARSCVATGGAAAEGEAMLDRFEAELEELKEFANGGYSEEALSEALVMQGKLKPESVQECYRAVHAIKWAKVEESMLKDKAYADRKEAEKYAERLGRLVGPGTEEKIEKLEDKVASQELELVHLREELAARKAERDDAIQEVRRLIKGDAELRLEKDSLEAENALLTERSNTMQKYMDMKAPYMVLSDGIPRRQDSLESLVPDFEWQVFLQGMETAVKRLQEDKNPKEEGRQAPGESLAQSLSETRQGRAENVEGKVHEAGHVQDPEGAKTSGQHLREQSATGGDSEPVLALASSTSKTTAVPVEIPGNAVAPKFQDLSVHLDSQQTSVEQSVNEDRIDTLNVSNDQASYIPKMSDVGEKLEPQSEIHHAPSASSAPKVLPSDGALACPKGWRGATAIFDYDTENMDEHCFKDGDGMYVKEAPEDPGWYWSILVALGSEGRENVRLVPSTHVTLDDV